MKILITGACGFLGHWMATELLEHFEGVQLIGLDNMVRAGSQNNRQKLKAAGVDFYHGDLRMMSDLDSLPSADWVIDCAALASVLAGTAAQGNQNGAASPRQLLEHNLAGSLNLLEYCRVRGSGLVLISTSRVYSIAALTSLPLVEKNGAFSLDTESLHTDSLDTDSLNADQPLPPGLTANGIDETFSNEAPISIYGATKLASETMAKEYAAAFDFPLRINRCGLLAGAGQFGRPDQGIFSFWIHSHLRRRPLRYIGFGGGGLQVRDCLHPRDVARLVAEQIQVGRDDGKPIVANVSGGIESARSLCQTTQWCDQRFGKHPVGSSDQVRPFDLPWVVLDSSAAANAWQWKPSMSAEMIFDEIADHAAQHPDWLDQT